MYYNKQHAVLSVFLLVGDVALFSRAFGVEHQPRSSSLIRMKPSAASSTLLRNSAAENSDDQEGSDDSDDDSPKKKTFFQRAFYRLSPGSDVDDYKSMVVEERVRFVQAEDGGESSESNSRLVPMGPRTILLREGDVEDGEIGDAFLTLQVEPSHRGLGLSGGAIGTALYLASNPTLVDEKLLEVDAGAGGLGSLLGCVGAGFVTRGTNNFRASKDDDDDVDILLPTKDNDDQILPEGLEKLTITDPDETNLNIAIALAKQIGIGSNTVTTEALDWAHRSPQKRRAAGSGIDLPVEYFTVLCNNLRGTSSYPEIKNLAHHVANRLAGMRSYPTKALPKFVHIISASAAEDSNNVKDLHKLVTDGYLMTASTSQINVEKLLFKMQSLENVQSAADEIALDFDVVLELDDLQDIPMQCMTCTHSPDYAGGGSGELYFPMETGLYDGSVQGGGRGSAFLEREPGLDGPWSS